MVQNTIIKFLKLAKPCQKQQPNVLQRLLPCLSMFIPKIEYIFCAHCSFVILNITFDMHVKLFLCYKEQREQLELY